MRDDKILIIILLVIASPLIMMGINNAVDSYSKNMAHRDIVVACYQAHRFNCDTIP